MFFNRFHIKNYVTISLREIITFQMLSTQTRSCLYSSTTHVLELIGVLIFSAIRPFFQDSHRVFVVRARKGSILFGARSATKGFIRFQRLRITVPTKIMNTHEIVTFHFFQCLSEMERERNLESFDVSRIEKIKFSMQIALDV